ncbi:hypothetical protein AC1031_012147 [Aphanomyces cochlioides]|nr:hypothetical protein AC1031_012147 [Aphanomyces cochlioides]
MKLLHVILKNRQVMSFPSVKLTYFNFAARGETTRLALTIGDVPFEDERIDYTTWAVRKPSMPYKKVPVLTVDGQMLCQSHAIARYAAKLAGLYPTDNHLEACRIDEMTDSVDEFILLLAKKGKDLVDAEGFEWIVRRSTWPSTVMSGNFLKGSDGFMAAN